MSFFVSGDRIIDNNDSKLLLDLSNSIYEYLFFAFIISIIMIICEIIRALPQSDWCLIVITLLVFVCPSEKIDIGPKFYTVRDMAFIFGKCVPYDHTFPISP